MDNNVSSTSPVPIFVPRIMMVATYTQDTQTHSITASVSTQTDSNLLNITTTQTKSHYKMNKHKLFQHLHPSQYKLNTFRHTTLQQLMKMMIHHLN